MTDFRYATLATLGDPPVDHLTASYIVAEQARLAKKIIGCESYDAAAESVKRGEADVALVAAAYPGAGKIILDKKLHCVDTFIGVFPPLVIGGAPRIALENPETLYYQPAFGALLEEVPIQFKKVVKVTASSAAAVKAKDDRQGIALCFQPAANYYGLTSYQTVRPNIHMPYMLFERVDAPA